MNNNKSVNVSFLKSALTEKNPFITTKEVIDWIKERNKKISINVKKIPFKELKNWNFDHDTGRLKHDSGYFFSIDGIHVTTNWGSTSEWDQPIINQPEIGLLGIIAKEFDGVLYFLLQAKAEPGNINGIQLSPTLQATKSNYTQVHKGNKPLYLDYFINTEKDKVLLDQLQSEQGARFLRKRNRNIIIKVDSEIEVFDNFIWLTIGQIKKLMRNDNLINMNTRTVISGISYGNDKQLLDMPVDFGSDLLSENLEMGMLLSAINEKSCLHSLDEILNWITSLKCDYELSVKRKSVFELKNWKVSENEIHHIYNQYFKIIAASVEIGNREVNSWTQPLFEPLQIGMIAFIIKKINGVYHFLIQAKLESGNFDIIEMAPTVQCLTGSYVFSSDLPFLQDVMLPEKHKVRYNCLQSEEGGRFFKEQNINIIVEVDDSFPIEVPDNYMWMTLNQLLTFLKFNNYLNIQSRSLLSAISFI